MEASPPCAWASGPGSPQRPAATPVDALPPLEGTTLHRRPSHGKPRRCVEETLQKLTEDSVRASPSATPSSPPWGASRNKEAWQNLDSNYADRPLSVASKNVDSIYMDRPTSVASKNGDSIYADRPASVASSFWQNVDPQYADRPGSSFSTFTTLRAGSPIRNAPTDAASPVNPSFDAEGLRLAFREEALDLLERCDFSRCIMRWSEQFSEWHRSDTKVGMQVQDGVEKLLAMQQVTHHRLEESLLANEVAEFKGAVADCSRTLNDLLMPGSSNQPPLLSESLKQVVESVLANTCSSLAAELTAATDVWHRLGEVQQKRWIDEDRRWSDLDSRMQKLEDRTLRVAEEVACQESRSQTRFERVLQEVVGRTESTMTSATKRLATSLQDTAEDMIASLKKVTVDDVQSLKHHFDRRIVGTEQSSSEGAENDEHLHGLMTRFAAQLESGVSSHKQAEQWHNELQALRNGKDEVMSALEQAKAEKENMSNNIQDFDRRIAGLEAELEEKESALQAPVAWKTLHRQIQAVEAKGHVKVDLQTGEIEVIGGIDFPPANPSDPPVAAFKSQAAAEKALEDLAQLLRSFKDVDLCIESHSKAAKGAATFWESLAVSRAELVSERLVELGLKPGLLSTKGLHGDKGVNRNCIKVKLNLFPAGAAAAPSKK